MMLGCASQRSAREPRPTTPPKRSKESEDSTYSYDFPEASPAWQAYQQLKALGIKDRQLDKGCPTLKILKDGTGQRRVWGQNDKKVTACEVQEFSLNHYLEHPEVAKLFAGNPIPWSLDDLDPDTEYDQIMRDQIEGAIARLNLEIEQLGYPRGSEAYQERMAVGLTYLFSVPGIWKHHPEFKDQYAEVIQELTDLGLNNLALHIQNRSPDFGFRPSDGVEYSALEALRRGTGNCTEQSKVLFDMFKRAGLDPFFVYVDLWDTNDPFIKDQVKKNPGYKHVCLGLRLGNKVRLFDPTLASVHPPHVTFYPLTLREYLGHDYLNHGMFAFGQGDLERAMSMADQAISLGENFGHAHTVRGLVWMKESKYPEAFKEHSSAIELNGRDPMFWSNRAGARIEMGDASGAIADLNQAIALNADYWTAYFNRASAFFSNGQESMARKDFVKFLGFDLDIGPQTVAAFLTNKFRPHWEKGTCTVKIGRPIISI